jgi:hypothetical protein
MKIYTIVLICFLGINFSFAQNTDSTKDSTENTATETPKVHKKKGGFFQKMIAKVAKVAGGAGNSMSGMQSTTDDLIDKDIISSLVTNVYSKDLGIVLTDFISGGWIDNGDFTQVTIASKNGFQFYKYSGAIKSNGLELKHQSIGVHVGVDKPNTGAKKITFEKNGKEEGSFIIPYPAKNIKLVSINGQKSDATVDFTKDMTLEFANYSTDPDALLRLDIVVSVIGIRTTALLCYVKSASKVVVPAAVFKNFEDENGSKFKDSYISVSDVANVMTQNNTGICSVPFMTSVASYSGMWINGSNQPENSKGISIIEDFKYNDFNLQIEGKTKNASGSMPLSFVKKIAVSALSVQGTNQLYDSKTNRWTQTETTKSLTFPQIPDARLESFMEEMYTKFTATASAINSSKLMPVNTIPDAPSYLESQRFYKDEVNNADQFFKVYKSLHPTKPLTTMYNRLTGDNALIKETGADALLKINMTLQLSYENKALMTPYLSIELVGAPNGSYRSSTGNTKYYTIKIKGNSYELKNKKEVDFEKLFQIDAFNAAYIKVLGEIKNKEAASGDYEKIWNVQK